MGSALTRHRYDRERVFISAHKSMTLRLFIHSPSKRAEINALVDSGATENFFNLSYARYLGLPIKWLEIPRKLFNVDNTENKSGELKYYTDLRMQMGQHFRTLRFYLTDLGDNKCILGYPWFAAAEPHINWKRGWIDYEQLPLVLCAPGAEKARFIPRSRNIPRLKRPLYFIGKAKDKPHLQKIPPEYHRHEKVFSEQASHRLPAHSKWDHAIELLPGAPSTIPGKLLPLNQLEIAEQEKFVDEHLERGTIQPSDSPFASKTFYVKKKDGKLRPI
jgi:hypothetical protein